MTNFNVKKYLEYKKDKRYSSSNICIKLEISRGTLWGWETAKRIPPDIKIRELAELFEISVDKISDLRPKDIQSAVSLQKSTDLSLTFLKNNSSQNKYITELINCTEKIGTAFKSTNIIINAIMHSNPNYCYIKDANLNYIFANSAFLKHLELLENYDITGKKDSDFFTPKEALMNTKQDENVLSTGKQILNYEDWIIGSKKKKWGLTFKYPILEENEKIIGVIGFIIDITEQKKAKDINLILKEALDFSKEAFCIIDLVTKKLVYTNKYRETIYGYPIQKFLDMKNNFWLHSCVHPDDKKSLSEYEDLFEWPEKREFRIVRPNGEIRHLEARKVTTSKTYNGNKCVAFYDTDVTEKIESDYIFNMFIYMYENSSDAVAMFNLTLNRCEYANEKFIIFLQYKQFTDFKDKNVNEVFSLEQFKEQDFSKSLEMVLTFYIPNGKTVNSVAKVIKKELGKYTYAGITVIL